MVFARELRERIRRGRITCSVRIRTRPHVKAGGTYPMDDGPIVVESIEPITLKDMTARTRARVRLSDGEGAARARAAWQREERVSRALSLRAARRVVAQLTPMDGSVRSCHVPLAARREAAETDRHLSSRRHSSAISGNAYTPRLRGTERRFSRQLSLCRLG